MPVPRTSPSSGCCTCRRAAGRAHSSSRRSGWPRRRRSRSPPRPSPTLTGGRATASSSGCPGTGYRGDGAFGQFCVVLPEQDTVIVTTAYTLDMQAVLDAMWAHLLPGLGTASPGAGSAHDQLGDRLARLELPACPGAPAPAGWGPWGSGPFTTITASGGGTEVRPFLTSVEVMPRAGGWQLSLIEAANALTVPVGAGTWAVSDQADRN